MLDVKLLVGLGNPGTKYVHTRHNVGFMALDRISGELNTPFGKKEAHSAFLARHASPQGEILLVKPQTFMNRSGKAVAALMKKYSIKPEEITVIHDDIDVPLGKVKEKTGGGSAGHNGIASIAEEIGTPDFRRIRIGVGRPPEWMNAADYVLSPFEEREKAAIDGAIEESCRRALSN